MHMNKDMCLPWWGPAGVAHLGCSHEFRCRCSKGLRWQALSLGCMCCIFQQQSVTAGWILLVKTGQTAGHHDSINPHGVGAQLVALVSVVA